MQPIQTNENDSLCEIDSDQKREREREEFKNNLK